MCGIAGWVDYQQDLSTQPDIAAAMTRTMALRGPDDEGLWLSRHAALGYRRLAVIDIAGGDQPVIADGQAVIVYSGETYNFRELRCQLTGRGHHFRTRSDTEVVLHAYLEWGAGFTERLNGMYALAIWDLRTRELLLARDRLGVKPLYYAPTAAGLLFGSEPKAILANPAFTPRLDDEGLAELLTLTKTPGHAVFRGMREVRPGYLVRLTRDGCGERRYWGLTATRHTDDLPATLGRVRELLTDAVSRQLVADVPLCTLLSGGLDSSVLTALAHTALGRAGPVRTFSVGFTGQTGGAAPGDIKVCGVPPEDPREADDAPFVADVVNHVGTQHTEVVLGPDLLTSPGVREAVLRARDHPGVGDTDISLYLLFAEVRKHSTVALSGEFADEVFGGYRWFHEPTEVGAATFPWMHSTLANASTDPLLDAGFLSRLDLPGYLGRRYREALAEVPHLPGESPHEHRMREICYLHLTWFRQLPLDRADRMSMATGLEVRVPFSDHHLVEYVFNVPWSLKAYDRREKSLLRGAAAGLLPGRVLRRRKSPYPATRSPAYEHALRARLRAILDDPASPVHSLADREAVRAALARPVGTASLQRDRVAMERLVGLNDWFATYQPVYEGAVL
jgi:asparagine synthase (glutamine-hydrolysing)